jgi:DNA-binding CsgD family transcriptional regulator
MTRIDALARGRESCARRAWGDAYAQLSLADREAPLEPDDLERLATAAYLFGKDADDTWARAHHEFLNGGDREAAARCAFWLAFGLLDRGDAVRGGGWISRAQRLLDDDGRHDCVLQGYLLLPVAIRRVVEGDAAAAYSTFVRAGEIGDRFHDTDLVAAACHGRGRALIRLGKIGEGRALLDEAMVAVTAGEVSPMVAGDIYCSVIEACYEIFDLRRAQEWTSALTDWCASQADLVPYRGQCLIRRAELMQLHGAWPAAMDEAQRACERLSQPTGQAALGAAFYQRADLLRLRGEFTKSEEAYRQANQHGRRPQPGLSQLRLAQGQIDAAAGAIRRVVEDAKDRRTRSKLLAAFIEIMLAAHDVPAARAAAKELSEIAAVFDSLLLRAASAHASGAVLLAEGDARGASAALHDGWTAWRQLEAPFEEARTRVLMAQACRELGDADTAALELEAARQVFKQLGAAPDLARTQEFSQRSAPEAAGGLSAREVQVIRLLATGKTNRAIADELFISEKTVGRHVSNIFTKLGLSSRAAATAYAYKHDLV